MFMHTQFVGVHGRQAQWRETSKVYRVNYVLFEAIWGSLLCTLLLH